MQALGKDTRASSPDQISCRVLPRNHGYDANHPDMHAFFLATGPSVRPRKEPRMPAFRNVEVHNLAMAMLGVDAAKNDGTPGFWSPLIESP